MQSKISYVSNSTWDVYSDALKDHSFSSREQIEIHDPTYTNAAIGSTSKLVFRCPVGGDYYDLSETTLNFTVSKDVGDNALVPPVVSTARWAPKLSFIDFLDRVDLYIQGILVDTVEYCGPISEIIYQALEASSYANQASAFYGYKTEVRAVAGDLFKNKNIAGDLDAAATIDINPQNDFYNNGFAQKQARHTVVELGAAVVENRVQTAYVSIPLSIILKSLRALPALKGLPIEFHCYFNFANLDEKINLAVAAYAANATPHQVLDVSLWTHKCVPSALEQKNLAPFYNNQICSVGFHAINTYSTSVTPSMNWQIGHFSSRPTMVVIAQRPTTHDAVSVNPFLRNDITRMSLRFNNLPIPQLSYNNLDSRGGMRAYQALVAAADKLGTHSESFPLDYDDWRLNYWFVVFDLSGVDSGLMDIMDANLSLQITGGVVDHVMYAMVLTERIIDIRGNSDGSMSLAGVSAF